MCRHFEPYPAFAYSFLSARIPLGFTFSYPAMQNHIDHGELTTWTKGFDIEGVEGQDVVKQLGDAIEKRVSKEDDMCGWTCVAGPSW